MKRLQEYRDAAFAYLNSRLLYFNLDTDVFLDAALRDISALPLKPKDHDSYNGLLGMKPVVEQRKLCLKILFKRISNDYTRTTADYLVDSAIRVLNSLPDRPEGKDPYIGLFKLPEEKTVKNSTKLLSEYTVSEEGIDLIHSFESYRRCTYKDPGSKSGLPITGGWGSTRLNGEPLQLGQCFEKETWDAQFKKDLDYFESSVKAYIRVPITQGMYDALVSWVYNCGVSVLTESTAIRRLNNKNYVGAAEALQWYNKGGNGKVLAGLVRRRQAEAKLFLKED